MEYLFLKVVWAVLTDTLNEEIVSFAKVLRKHEEWEKYTLILSVAEWKTGQDEGVYSKRLVDEAISTFKEVSDVSSPAKVH